MAEGKEKCPVCEGKGYFYDEKEQVPCPCGATKE